MEQAQQPKPRPTLGTNKATHRGNARRASKQSRQHSRSRDSGASRSNVRSRGPPRVGQPGKLGNAEAVPTRAGHVRQLHISSRKLAGESYNQKRAHKIRDFLLAKKMNLDLSEYLARSAARVRYGSNDQVQESERRQSDGTMIQSLQTVSDEEFQLRPPASIPDAVNIEEPRNMSTLPTAYAQARAHQEGAARVPETRRLQQKSGVISVQVNNGLGKGGALE